MFRALSYMTNHDYSLNSLLAEPYLFLEDEGGWMRIGRGVQNLGERLYSLGAGSQVITYIAFRAHFNKYLSTREYIIATHKHINMSDKN